MKHASDATLLALEPLLVQLRSIQPLVERKPGIFYLQSSAFLHFREDPAGTFVDVKLNGRSFDRIALPDASDWPVLAKQVVEAIQRSAEQARPGANRPR